ncbi:MAG: EAL domain-containing protein [Eubacterium sp.]|nr:EAL domain-containing protein [Eubacterium sp.]
MHSIRFRITAITIVAIIITELCVTAVTFFTVQSAQTRESVQMMDLLAENTKNSIGKYIDSIEQSVDMASNIASDSMDRILLVESGVTGRNGKKGIVTAEDQKKLDEYLEGYCKDLQESLASVASHTHGVVTYYFCISPGISRNVHGFYFSKIGKTGFFEQEPLDASQMSEEDAEQNVWYTEPVKHGHPMWVGPYRSDELGEMTICSYVVPIYDSGILIGVLGMDIPLVTLISQVKSIKVYKTGFACLYDENDRVIYHPNRPYGSDEDPADLGSRTDLLEKGTSGDELIRYNYQGQMRQVSFCTLQNGMIVAIVAPVSEINSTWTEVARNEIATTAIIILIVAVIVMLIMRSVTNPLLRLTDASRRLANADYDVELDYKGKDEVGVLTASFIQMRDKIKQYISDLNRRIFTDDMTGLPNTRYFFDLGEAARNELLKDGRKPALLYFNLIGMKNFNRQYGYDVGNDLICAFAETLSRHYTEKCICRLNQDHFAAVTDEDGMEDELLDIFMECQSINSGMALPVHVGIYQYSMGDVNVATACDRAKYACDKHRDSYFSAFYYFKKDMQKEAEDARYIIGHLDQALSEGWIQVYYQPIMFAATGEKCDEEALSRWLDPEKGLLPPDDFIPYLEKAGLLYKLDLYVLERVLEKIRLLQKAGKKAVPVSVNLSRKDFDTLDMVEEIRQRVDDAGVERDMITIEITESTLGSNFDFMSKQVERFQKLGFPVWMDDFGSGYSSLDVLQDIQFDLIKLDMRFMRRFGESEKERIIVRELLHMATDLSVDTICEGVETGEQVGFLRNNGCTKLQGFFYSRPVPFDESELS